MAAYLGEKSPDLPMELFMQFVRLDVPEGITKILDLKWPGSSDLFGIILMTASEQYSGGSVGFQRGGILGYSTIVVPLVEQTISAIERAAQEFGW